MLHCEHLEGGHSRSLGVLYEYQISVCMFEKDIMRI